MSEYETCVVSKRREPKLHWLSSYLRRTVKTWKHAEGTVLTDCRIRCTARNQPVVTFRLWRDVTWRDAAFLLRGATHVNVGLIYILNCIWLPSNGSAAHMIAVCIMSYSGSPQTRDMYRTGRKCGEVETCFFFCCKLFWCLPSWRLECLARSILWLCISIIIIIIDGLMHVSTRASNLQVLLQPDGVSVIVCCTYVVAILCVTCVCRHPEGCTRTFRHRCTASHGKVGKVCC
jgi:hypothetical protein